RDLIQRLLMGASDITQQALYLKDLFDFFEMQPTITSPAEALKVPEPIREGFVFENVGFQYPGSERWAVRNVSFRLPPGERVAFVGENGAGKTTLTKLLARLYDPTEGRILLDGRDLREYDLGSLRRAIGVIFQDFVRYAMRFDENIGVGEIDKVRAYLDTVANESGNGDHPVTKATASGERNGHAAKVTKAIKDVEAIRQTPEDSPAVPEPIASAADKSLASSLLGRFSEGYRQMLGRRFE